MGVASFAGSNQVRWIWVKLMLSTRPTPDDAAATAASATSFFLRLATKPITIRLKCARDSGTGKLGYDAWASLALNGLEEQ